MKTIKFTIKKPRRRAIELFHKDSPFKPKVVESKVNFKRHSKHKGKQCLELSAV